jgi:hypothetical protein
LIDPLDPDASAKANYPEKIHLSGDTNAQVPGPEAWPMRSPEAAYRDRVRIAEIDAEWFKSNTEMPEPMPLSLEEDAQSQPEAENKINFSLARLAMNGVYRAGRILRDANHLAAMPINALDNATRFISVQALNRLPSFEKTSAASSVDDISENQPETRKSRKKIIYGAVGAVALAGIGIGALYLSSKGLSHNINPARLHEAASSAPAPKHNPVTEAAANIPSPFNTQPELKAVVHQTVAQTINKVVNIKPGDGYTQVISKLFPNHNPTAYLGGYKEAIRQLGPNFIKGIHHYRMANGNWGFSGSGKAELTKPALHLLSNFFKSHQ